MISTASNPGSPGRDTQERHRHDDQFRRWHLAHPTRSSPVLIGAVAMVDVDDLQYPKTQAEAQALIRARSAACRSKRSSRLKPGMMGAVEPAPRAASGPRSQRAGSWEDRHLHGFALADVPGLVRLVHRGRQEQAGGGSVAHCGSTTSAAGSPRTPTRSAGSHGTRMTPAGTSPRSSAPTAARHPPSTTTGACPSA